MTEVHLIGDEDVEIEATLNGKPLKRRVKARQHLADFLRQEIELTGTHLGCEHGICGACTVLLDGRTARGCLTLAAQISGKSVETIEGLTESGKLAELQKEFIERNAAQCAFCSSGMLLTAYELISIGEKMSRAQIREALSGNMCRCTGYHAIIDAVEAVIAKSIGRAKVVSTVPPSSTGIGARIPRRELKRLVSGHGRYVDDIKLPRMLHACFVRSPHPHAKILSMDIKAAKSAQGVAAVFTAADINPRCEPFVGVALHRPGHRSAPQSLLAADRAVWQGQPVAVVVADSRAEAEDAAELVSIEWEPLPVVGDQLQAIAPETLPIHPELADNVAFDFALEKGQPTQAFAEADVVIEEELRFERQMAMTLEARGLIADFDPSDGSLTVIHAHQSPFQMQDVFSRHLHIPNTRSAWSRQTSAEPSA